MIDDQQWSEKYTILYKTTKDTKLRTLQYKILHRRYATNEFLFKINIKDEDLCSFCKSETETLEHLFYSCNTIRTFQQDLINEFDQIITENSLEFFLMCSTAQSTASNFLIILQKYYIHTCRYLEKMPDIESFKNIFQKRLKIEAVSAKTGNWYNRFERMWGEYI